VGSRMQETQKWEHNSKAALCRRSERLRQRSKRVDRQKKKTLTKVNPCQEDGKGREGVGEKWMIVGIRKPINVSHSRNR